MQTDVDIESDKLMKENEAADLLCQSVRTIQKWRVSGHGPPYFKIGRSVRYRRAELVTWIDRRRTLHTSAA